MGDGFDEEFAAVGEYGLVVAGAVAAADRAELTDGDSDRRRDRLAGGSGGSASRPATAVSHWRRRLAAQPARRPARGPPRRSGRTPGRTRPGLRRRGRAPPRRPAPAGRMTSAA